MPGDRGGLLARFIGLNRDLVMLANAVALLFKPPDALQDFVIAPLAARLGKRRGKLRQPWFEALDKAPDDGHFLLLTPRGVTI
jgi:hypothetical protein